MTGTPATAIKKPGLVFAVCLLLAALAVPSLLIGRVVVWYAFWGPPVDLDAPHDGRIVAHIDYLARVPGDIARIRISDAGSGAVLWDVRPVSGKPACWNRCWNLTLQAGENAASFRAGPQQFQAQVPHGSASFVLARGTRYRFEVWDPKGRVITEHFRL
jgi:hypothetical protein